MKMTYTLAFHSFSAVINSTAAVRTIYPATQNTICPEAAF